MVVAQDLYLLQGRARAQPNQEELVHVFNPYVVLSLHIVYCEALSPESCRHCFSFFPTLFSPFIRVSIVKYTHHYPAPTLYVSIWEHGKNMESSYSESLEMLLSGVSSAWLK